MCSLFFQGLLHAALEGTAILFLRNPDDCLQMCIGLESYTEKLMKSRTPVSSNQIPKANQRKKRKYISKQSLGVHLWIITTACLNHLPMQSHRRERHRGSLLQTAGEGEGYKRNPDLGRTILLSRHIFQSSSCLLRLHLRSET